jgi:hypothetical protein
VLEALENKGEGLTEGLHGREGWKSSLLGGTGWVEESWVLRLLWVWETYESLRDDWFGNPVEGKSPCGQVDLLLRARLLTLKTEDA